MEKLYCPYCGSEKFHPYGDRYECDECHWLFDEEDIKWQELRHQISHHLIDTDEEHPFVFKPNDMPVIGEDWDDTIGLSTLEMPHIDQMFQVPGDGTIWFHIEGEYEDFFERTKPIWHDLEEQDYLILSDLQSIVEAFEWVKGGNS